MVGVPSDDGQGLLAIAGRIDGEACFAERVGEVFVDGRVIFGEEDAQAAVFTGGAAVGRGRLIGGDGQVDTEGGALSEDWTGTRCGPCSGR